MHPKINKIVVVPLSRAFTSGNIDTSSAPSIPSGLGPKIKKATVKLITADKI
jgi:hypothetical protein